ncbi:hypothetical protein [Nonomuraea sp. JJY05]|uniref:hypothetical protein n=1 Tax=Nonomuraea sp. JJY05 TaxID=3350255 RepID=UPI00373E8847
MLYAPDHYNGFYKEMPPFCLATEAHEVRTWIAAFASLAATGRYRMTFRFYRAIPEWIAGFAVATASPQDAR